MPRPKGSPNKATKAREEIISRQGATPLSYMLEVLRSDESSDEDRRWAAEKAAPYVHPRLTSIDARLQAEINGQVEHVHVIDARNLDADKRLQLRQLLLSAAVSDRAEDVEFEEVSEDEG